MSAETLIPDAILAQTNLSGAVTDIDDDPDSPDGLWLTASSNNINVDVRTSFGTPTGNPTVGADLQEFKALCRQIDEGQTGQPDARIELWESGSLVRAGTNETVPDGGVVVSFTWNANELATADGSAVELKVVGTKSGGSPTARNTVEVGAVEWNADVSANVVVTPPTANLSLTTYVPTIDVSDHKIATPPTASLSLTTYVPTVTASDHQIATPPKATLTLTAYVPSVTLGIKVIPPKATLVLTTYVPTVTASDNQLVTPPKATLTLTTYVPTVTASDHKTATPPKATLTLTTYVPLVTLGIKVNPPKATLTLTTYVPTITTTQNKLVKPPKATLALTTYVPTVTASDNKTAAPLKATLTLTTYIPIITVSGGGGGITVTPLKATLTLTTYPPFIKLENPARNVSLAHYLDAAFAPGINDDSDKRYSVGSMWIDTTADIGYMCVDSSVGAAVWKQITA